MTGDISMSSTGATTIGDATAGTAQVEDNAITEGKLAICRFGKANPYRHHDALCSIIAAHWMVALDGSELSASETALEAVLNGNYGTGLTAAVMCLTCGAVWLLVLTQGRLAARTAMSRWGSSAAHADVSSGSGNRLPSYLITGIYYQEMRPWQQAKKWLIDVNGETFESQLGHYHELWLCVEGDKEFIMAQKVRVDGQRLQFGHPEPDCWFVGPAAGTGPR